MKEFYAVFYRAQRLKNTRDGNPVWYVFTSHGTYKTQPNAQIGHKIVSYANEDGPEYMKDRQMKVTVSDNNHITGLEPSDES
jgi:hypothetical protein